MRAAIYARQSADRHDSISIESQIDYCRAIAGDNPYIFSDKGYSGANLDRPSFCELMELVRENKTDRIIIYRLDRISRSLIDFVTLSEELKKHKVTLISKSEGFDTSSETSSILLNILMMFAQMERNAISQRVRDNYYARGKMGLYLGGYSPFGYDKTEFSHGGIKTSRLIRNSQADAVLSIYEAYVYRNKSYNSIAADLNDIGIKTRNSGIWTAGSVRRILRNPVYVIADLSVYRYFVACGAVIHSAKDAFSGKNGCICFSSPKSRKKAKFTTLEGENIVVGLHEGIIPSSLWLAAQERHSYSNNALGEASWLQGLMKCECGYSLYTKRYKDRKYLCCHGRKLHVCNVSHIVTCDELERLIEPLIGERLSFLSQFSDNQDTCEDCENELIELDEKLSRLVRLFSQSRSDEAVIIEREISSLKEKRLSVCMVSHTTSTPKPPAFGALSFTKKKLICRQLINRIELSGDRISLIWT